MLFHKAIILVLLKFFCIRKLSHCRCNCLKIKIDIYRNSFAFRAAKLKRIFCVVFISLFKVGSRGYSKVVLLT